MYSFTFININNINNASLFNSILDKYKEIYSYSCEHRKYFPRNEDVLCLKIKYNIISDKIGGGGDMPLTITTKFYIYHLIFHILM